MTNIQNYKLMNATFSVNFVVETMKNSPDSSGMAAAGADPMGLLAAQASRHKNG